MTVNVGDTVTWTNNGPTPHSATSSSGVFDTGIMDAGQSGSHTFTEAGTFAYICTPHPNMHGTVVVQAAAVDDGTGDDTGTTPTDSQADDGPGAAVDRDGRGRPAGARPGDARAGRLPAPPHHARAGPPSRANRLVAG